MTVNTLPFDPDTDRLVERSTLLAEVARLRAEVARLGLIVDGALYWRGQEECFEGDCDCPEYVDENGDRRPGLDHCPNIQICYARQVDALVRGRLEDLLSDVLDMLGADTPPDWAHVREEIHAGVRRAGEAVDDDDPRGEKDHPDLYRRVYDADQAETLAVLSPREER